MGGPLLVVPASALASWGGATTTAMITGGTGTLDDYGGACTVKGLAGAIAVGGEGAQALVLADEPATSCYLPGHRAFLRWLAVGISCRWPRLVLPLDIRARCRPGQRKNIGGEPLRCTTSSLCSLAPDMVREIVGHSDIEVTMTIYAHTALDEKRQTLAKLGDALT